MSGLNLFEAEFVGDFETRKAEFLRSLKGRNLAYKRYNGAVLRYGGGKSLAVGLILEHLPRVERVISPFIGGGSVEIAIACELNLEVKAFDIFDILVNFYHILLTRPNELFCALSELKPEAQTYASVKAELKRHWEKTAVLEPLTLARDYYFNFNLSYGPGFLGWMSSVYADCKRYKKNLEKLREFKAPNLSVECADFTEVFERFPNDFFYLDPPYFLDGDSKMFKGIYPMRNFPVHHNGFRHDVLAECLKRHKGGFILSYNDCKFVREAYKEFKILEPSWQYTMGQGEKRMGKNRLERGDENNIKKSHELMIVKEI